MSGFALPAQDVRHWSGAGLIALAAHGIAIALVLAWVRPVDAPVPEPVVLIELPPQAAPPAAASAVEQPKPDVVSPQSLTPPLDIPPVRAPLPKNPVTLPPTVVRQTAPATASAVTAAPAPTSAATVAKPSVAPAAATTPGNDPNARRQEADYFSLVSAHLNKRKSYPSEARQARQQGVVTVRFTVDRSGAVSGISIKRSSGHDILDSTTVALVQRVAPLPRMPASMQRDSVTLSLPIEYALKTN